MRNSHKGTGSGQTASPYDLEPTHGQTMSNGDFNKLVDDVKANGVTESVKYVEYEGTKYIVDGHHRVRAAKFAGLDTIPIEKVSCLTKGIKLLLTYFGMVTKRYGGKMSWHFGRFHFK